jgi:hypothetical protein
VRECRRALRLILDAHPVLSVAATITGVSSNLVPSGALICTDVGADAELCGLPAEWSPSKTPYRADVHRPSRSCEPGRVPDTAYNSS